MAKQNKTKLYAKALAEVLYKGVAQAKEKKIIDNFLKLLLKGEAGACLPAGRKKAKEILNLAEDLLLVKQGKRKIFFQTARKMTSDQKKMMKDFVKTGDVVKEKINPELIAGIKIIINDSKQFDASMQSKLQKIN